MEGHKYIIITILSLAALVQIVSSQQSECYPSFTLPNILKDQVSLQYNNGNEQSYPYLFFAGMFSGPPLIAYSISELSIDQTSSVLNYYLRVQIQDTNILFHFNSPTFKWSIVAVTFCITSRSDIVVLNNFYNSVNSGRTTTFNFPLNNNAALIDSKSTHMIFIVGLFCNYTSELTFSVNASSLSPTTAFIAISVGARVSITNISILSVIYNGNTGQFVSNSGTLNYKTFSNQYFNVFTNFMPIYYLLAGINSFSLTNINAFSYKLDLINSSVLASSSSVIFNSFGISYFTIGVPMKSVCEPCNNYVDNGICVDSCTSPTYSFVFSDGGKACLVCDAIVGQMLNSLGNGCSCLPGYQLISANQCSATTKTSLNCTGTNLIQNGTSCICSPGTYNISGVCGTCPNGQIYQNGACSSPTINCPPQSAYNAATQTCNCLPGYYNISGFCVSCPAGTTFNGFTCVTTCKDNQILVDGRCVCDSSSILVGSICVKCAAGTFVNLRTCDACIANCLVCLNKVTCSQCSDGYIFDFSSLACINPNVPAAQKLVSIKAGFPIYTLEGLITDFTINSELISAKSKADLSKMISIQFADANTTPIRIYYSQNPTQLRNIRVAFYYAGLVPMNPFKVTFLFADSTISLQQNTTITYQYTQDKLQYHSI